MTLALAFSLAALSAALAVHDEGRRARDRAPASRVRTRRIAALVLAGASVALPVHRDGAFEGSLVATFVLTTAYSLVPFVHRSMPRLGASLVVVACVIALGVGALR